MKAVKLLSFLFLGAWVVFSLTACSPDLNVVNQNAPDTERALASPSDVESLIAGSYLDWWAATQYSAPSMGLSTAADELTSSWGNWHMQNASTEPRIPYDNSPSYRYRAFAENSWYNCYSAISSANDGLKQIANGLIIEDELRTHRAKTFAKFVQGLAHGWLALFHDKAFVVDETVDLTTTQLDFQPYDKVMEAALGFLQEALTLAQEKDFTLPENWINGNPLTSAEFQKLIHTYMARFMAQVARTPEERAAVDWNAVLAHAEQAIDKDFIVQGDGNIWWSRLQLQGQHPIWVRADYMNSLGPADTSGNYQAWLNTPVQDRLPFLIHTADKRFPVGDPEGTGAYIRYAGQPRHRPDRGTYHFSYYLHYRFNEHLLSGATGSIYLIVKEEPMFLKAEALIRLGRKDEAAAIINQTRVNNGGLPPVTGDDPDLMKKLIYEKRLECWTTSGGLAFFDARGWGILVSGTPLHWPVPGKELEILQQEIYTFGGVGGPAAAPKRSREDVFAVFPE